MSLVRRLREFIFKIGFLEGLWYKLAWGGEVLIFCISKIMRFSIVFKSITIHLSTTIKQVRLGEHWSISHHGCLGINTLLASYPALCITEHCHLHLGSAWCSTIGLSWRFAAWSRLEVLLFLQVTIVMLRTKSANVDLLPLLPLNLLSWL